MLAELNAGLRRAPRQAASEPEQEPAQEPASESDWESEQDPASDILELTEQMAAAQSLPAAEFTFPDNFARENYEEEGSSETHEESQPVAAAEPPHPVHDHVRDADLENEGDSYRDLSKASLISATTTAAVDSAFNTLAQTVLVQNGRTLEDLVREMLRPMLKIWLDDNLPSMVERLVRAEIERVSRGR
jgi:uncharacterized protein